MGSTRRPITVRGNGAPGWVGTCDPRFRKGFQPRRCLAPKQWFRGSLRPVKAFRKAAQVVSSRRTQRHQDACTEALVCTVHACLVWHFGAVDWVPLGPWMAWPGTHRPHPRASSLPGKRECGEAPSPCSIYRLRGRQSPGSARRPDPPRPPPAKGLDCQPSCSPSDP
jgi:hypothetical protein